MYSRPPGAISFLGLSRSCIHRLTHVRPSTPRAIRLLFAWAIQSGTNRNASCSTVIKGPAAGKTGKSEKKTKKENNSSTKKKETKERKMKNKTQKKME